MKHFATAAWATTTVLCLAAPGAAGLCERCQGRGYITSVGRCANCGAPTASGAFELCEKCSAKLHQCERCRAPLPPAAGRPGKTIDPARTATYRSGPWEYRHQVPAAGAPKPVRRGALLCHGKPLPPPKLNDHYRTPWGKLYWVGEAKARHGWMPKPDPAHRSGKLLPPPPRPRKLVVTRKSDGKSVAANGTEEVLIRLPGKADAGMAWSLKTLTGDSLRATGKVRFIPGPKRGRRASAGGMFELRLRVLKPGKSVVTAEYVKPSEPKLKAAAVFTVTVEIGPDPTPERKKKLLTAVGRLTLTLQYHGEEDEEDNDPHRNLTLASGLDRLPPAPAWEKARISAAAARAIVEHLAADGFLCDAGNFLENAAAIALPMERSYTLTVSGAKGLELYENLGWGLSMLRRLEALHAVLDGKADLAMSEVLDRLRADRADWGPAGN